ncbi:uncharacterized protein [Prorops nasuta]|uniref:uncharacterized protein isoform X2 n=1 Tax=Prorops nasuta TaxID=863751 RepID=UPI0034CD754E
MSVIPFDLRLIRCSCRCWLLFGCLIGVFITSAHPSSSQTNPASTVTSTIGSFKSRRISMSGDADLQRSSRFIDNLDVDVYDDTDDVLGDDLDEDYLDENITEKGRYLGSPCEFTCNPELPHVFCDSDTGHCECDKLYPVQLGPTKGCAKPKKLGEQCFYRASCAFTDQHSTCTQVQHNAVCDCEEGYHRVSLSRPNKKIFCAEDLVLIKTDIPTLLGIASGIAVFTGLICFVLKLFSRARYTRPRHYANASHAPPMLFSNDTGIPLTIHGRPSSRSSQRSGSGVPLTCAFPRRPSSGGSRGPLVPASRAGSRRPSLASIHSSTSSARSYSARRLEKERNDKEQRQVLQELKLAKQKEQQQQQQVAPTPSPRTPHSTDELLPSVEEGTEIFYNEVPTTSDIPDVTQVSTVTTTATANNKIADILPSNSQPNEISEQPKLAPCATSDIFQV